MDNRHDQPANRLQAHEETVKSSVDGTGARFVNSSIRFIKAIAPGVNPIAFGVAPVPVPCDELYFSAAANVVFTPYEAKTDASEDVTMPVPANTWIKMGASYVKSVSAGNCFGGWYRRPPEA